MVGSPPDHIRACERWHWDGIGVALVLGGLRMPLGGFLRLCWLQMGGTGVALVLGCPQGCAWAVLGDIQVTLGQYCGSILVVLRWHLSIMKVASGQH